MSQHKDYIDFIKTNNIEAIKDKVNGLLMITTNQRQTRRIRRTKND